MCHLKITLDSLETNRNVLNNEKLGFILSFFIELSVLYVGKYYLVLFNVNLIANMVDLYPYSNIMFIDIELLLQIQKGACDKFDPSFYPRFKKWCDDYFYIKVCL